MHNAEKTHCVNDHEFTPENTRRTKSGRACIACANARTEEFNKRNPSRRALVRRKYNLKRLYGLTLEQYEELFETQRGLCAICRKPETITDRRSSSKPNLGVDHCHTTGRVRGLLCRTCNTGIGLLTESPEILHAAVQYLGAA